MKNVRYLRIRISIAFILFGISSAISCKKFVQIPPPNTQLVTATVFDNSAAATSAQIYIYTAMKNESFNMAQSCGLLSDELKNYSTNALLQQYYTNSMVTSTVSTSFAGPWATAYPVYIYPANAIINGLEKSNSLPSLVVKQLTGESKFIRAFWLFYLTNLYGDVPIVTTTDYTINSKLGRSTQADVYQQVINDLKDAESLLNANYVDASDTTITTERVRPNKATAQALLARAYLYTKQWAQAEIEATTVISNPMYKLCKNLDALMGDNYVFEKNSQEAIWQLQTPLPSIANTPDGGNFVLISAPKTTTNNSATVSSQLLTSFEQGDLRLQHWVGTYTNATINYKFPYKYHSYNVKVNSLSDATEYIMMLRLAEQYLIRAEARAQQQNTTGALADLNAIRNRAGLANYAGPTDRVSLLAAIFHERQVELFCEWGHRWFDLNRTNMINTVMGQPGGVYNAKGGQGLWNDNRRLMPIPQPERLNDPNLTQNPGY